MKFLCTLLLTAAALPAQKMPLPADRQLQLFDLEAVLGAADAPRPDALLEVPGGPAAGPAAARPDLQPTVELLRQLVEPALGPGDDIAVLGQRWLAVLGSPLQIASAERLLRLATERREQPIHVQVRFFELGEAVFAERVAGKFIRPVPRDGGATGEVVLRGEEAEALAELLRGRCTNQLDAPAVAVRPLQRATIASTNQTAYVRDFTVTKQKDALIAEPIVDVVWDGWQTEVVATWLPGDMVGLSCRVTHQEVDKPIAAVTTKVADLPTPLQFQVPRVHGTRLRQTAIIAADAVVALAAQKADGSWLVATLTARAAAK